MKTRMLVLLIALLVVVTLSFAGDKITINDIYGTWVNADYNEKGQAAKVISNSDNTFEFYNADIHTEPTWTAKITITDNWNDSEGNLMIKFIADWTESGATSYYLSKHSNSGAVWEMVGSGVDYPEELSPIAGLYFILYRQQ